jgi:hypothetical protein
VSGLRLPHISILLQLRKSYVNSDTIKYKHRQVLTDLPIRRVKFDGSRPDQRAVPQVPPGLHAADELLNESEPPEILDAKADIFLRTCTLPQLGQSTASMALALRRSSSNGSPQVVQMNSKIGIAYLPNQ